MKLQLQTLSPLHIGNGEKYNGLSYVQDKKQSPPKVCYLEFDIIKDVLTKQQLQNFADWVVTKKFPTLFKFLKDTLNDKSSYIDNLISKSLYKIEQLFKEDYQQRRFLGDIESFIKQNNKLYIPGTEIKGAMRTAVLYHLFNIDKNYEQLKENILKLKNNFSKTFSILATGARKDKDSLTIADLKQISKEELVKLFGKKRSEEIGQKLQNNIDPKITVNKIKGVLVKEVGNIEERLQKYILRCVENDDAKYDLFKLLHVGDTELKAPDNCLFVTNLEVTGISRDVPLFQELCKKDQIFICQYFMLDSNKTIIEKLGFNPEQKWVISDVNNLFKCCNEFTEKLLKEEIDYFRKLRKQQIVTKLQNIKQQNTPTSPVIRIGKNEGYFSLTMGLLVKGRDKALYDDVLCHCTKNTSYTGDFPKTRKVVNLGNGEQDTCGWVKLII